MQFNSLYFILMFLPVVLAVHVLVSRSSKKAGDLLLLAASFFFYGTQNLWYLLFLLISITVNYLLVLGIQKKRGAKGHGAGAAKVLFVLSLVFNIGFLGYFKYTGFFLENWNAASGGNVSIPDILLPIGISFYTFSEIAFLADVYRGQAWTEGISLADFALYAAYFPKILQGPIALPRDLVPQIRDREGKRVDSREAAIGVQMFVLGLSKKVLLADVFGKAADWGFQYLVLNTTGEMLLTMVSYTFQIYFDFSGYSDMALGAAKMLGFDLPANFNSPYKADSVTDFWRRWHISLTDFLREYIYFPLGGSRKGTVRTYVNILIVFLVSGFWHGANWTFIVWGIVHGLLQVFERANRKWYFKIPRLIRQVLMFVSVSILWMVFRCESFSDFTWVMHLLGAKTWHWGLRSELAQSLSIPGLRSVLSILHLPFTDYSAGILSTVLMFGFSLFLVFVPENAEKRQYPTTAGSLLLTLVLFAASILSLSSVSSFIYNNF